MQTKRLKQQQGGALAIAVFVIVVMTLLTVAISRNISASTEQSVQEVLGTRALMMAESANEIALAALFPLAAGAPAARNDCGDVNQNRQYFNNIAGFANCAVITTCADRTAGGDDYFLISSRSVCKDSVDNNDNDNACQNVDRICVSRQVEVEARTL